MSPHRLERPWQGQVEPPQPSDAAAPTTRAATSAPGTPAPTANATPRTPRPSSSTTTSRRCCPRRAGAPRRPGDDLFVAEPQSGRCRVVCFSPRHDLTLAQMDAAGIRAVVDTWADEVERLARADGIGYVQVFENKGAAMGCSNPHPHCQIWASATVPHMPARKLAMQRRYAGAARARPARRLPGARTGDRATRVVLPQRRVGRASCRSGPSGPSRRWSFRCGWSTTCARSTDDERDALADILRRLDRPLRQPLPVLVPVLDGLARPARRRPGASRLPAARGVLPAAAALGRRCGSSSSGTR